MVVFFPVERSRNVIMHIVSLFLLRPTHSWKVTQERNNSTELRT